VVAQVRCGLGHTACVARGADTTAFAGEGDQAVVTTIITTHPRKAVSEDDAFEVFAEGFLYVSGRGVMVALPVELPGAGEFRPSLEVLGYHLVEQRALGVAGVVGFGGFGRLGWLRGMRMPMRVMVILVCRSMGRALHGATPVGMGLESPLQLCLYSKLRCVQVFTGLCVWCRPLRLRQHSRNSTVDECKRNLPLAHENIARAAPNLIVSCFHFVTATEIKPLFGQTLARQVAQAL